MDAIYAGKPVLEAETIHWGLLYPVNPDAWNPLERIDVDLVDARVAWLPTTFDPNGEVGETLDMPTCLISVDTGVSGSIDRARDIGRPAVRQAAALTMASTRLIAGRQPIWEGAFVALEGEATGFTTVRRGTQVPNQTSDSIRGSMQPVIGRSVLSTASRSVALARHWYLRGWEATGLLDRFMNFWLAGAALYERHRPAGGDRERVGIRAYAVDLAARTGISPTIRDMIANNLAGAYELRNRIFHEGDFTVVDAQSVADLEQAVTQCILAETT